MTTFTTISNAAVAVGAIPSSATVQAFRDNPLAIAEGASGAPVLSSGWHPYNKVTIGDAATGIIYDSAVNGAVADITTPDFADGWEYKIVARLLGHGSGSARSLTVSGYDGTNYRAFITTATFTSSLPIGFDAEFMSPRFAQSQHLGLFINTVAAGMSMFYPPTAGPGDPTFKLDRARLTLSSATNISGGRVWFMRRRCYRTI